MKYRVDVSRGVRVGAHHYPILANKQATERMIDKSYYGCCYNATHRILVDGTLEETKFNETVVHEIIEAVNDIYCDSKLKHTHIVGLANGLTQAFDSLGVTFTHKDRKTR